MDETLKTELVRRGTEELQNKDAWFPRDSNGRSFSKDWFYIHLENARQTLPLRGHSEDLNTDGNCGNFLETFKLLAKYDPVAKQHLHRVQRTDGYIVSYLSPQSQNEFISLLGDHIRTVIFQNIIKAKYFAIMFDSTPDISHTDQMSQVIRYVHIEDSGVHVTESFIDFIQLYGKSADVITKQICDKLQADGLKLEHCYGQGYDNAATMAGHISGVQKRILDMNPKAMFVPCNNHSLNLAGMHAVGVGTKSVTFFGTVEKVYAFFSSSTHRWDILKKHVPICVKQSCNTRWSSKHEAVCVLAEHTEKIIDALEALRDGPEETSETRGDAGSLLVCIMTYVFFAFLHFWNPVLTEVNDTQIYLQQEGLALDQCVQKLKALALFCHEKRDSLVSKATEKALQVCKTYCIPTERRVGRRKKMDGENSCDAGLTLIQETSREQLEAIDQLQAEIKKRTTQMNTLHQRFAFLQIQTLLDTGKDDFIKKQIQHTCAQYTELNAPSMLTEITRLRHHIILYKEVNPDEQFANWSALDLLRWVYKWKLQESLTNFVVTLRIFLTITVSTARCERSFSKLKLIKTYQRSTMSQERLSNLAILSIERDFNVDFNSVVEKYALIKSRQI
ncbi:zinc finger MYM-type protein 1-like [Pleurodeles waltl]|uniref:zinc finger MYM-type protein 1-like n=1 Tax=Pleurodeles waltl TaxID=8319 RepID=UPI0037095D3A